MRRRGTEKRSLRGAAVTQWRCQRARVEDVLRGRRGLERLQSGFRYEKPYHRREERTEEIKNSELRNTSNTERSPTRRMIYRNSPECFTNQQKNVLWEGSKQARASVNRPIVSMRGKRHGRGGGERAGEQEKKGPGKKVSQNAAAQGAKPA